MRDKDKKREQEIINELNEMCLRHTKEKMEDRYKKSKKRK